PKRCEAFGAAACLASLRPPVRLRQYREHPERELPEIDDVDRAVVAVIEVRQESRLTSVQPIRRREEAEIGDIHAAIAVHVAKHAEQSLRVAERRVAAPGSVAVAVERP